MPRTDPQAHTVPERETSQTPVFDALIEEARRTGPDQWISHEDLGKRLGFTEDEHAAARARIERRRREDEKEETRGIHVTVGGPDPRGTLRELVTTMADTRAVAMLTFRMYRDLVEQTGSDLAAQQFLLALATDVNRPIAVNVPTEEGSQTVFIPPRGWTEERLQGFVGGVHKAAQAAFGPVQGRPRRVQDKDRETS